MPLQPKLLQIPFASGLDQKSDPRYLAVGSAAKMTNCVRLKNNAIRKRFGHTAIPSIGSSASRGFAYKGQTMASDGALLFAFSDTANHWTTLDHIPEAVALDRISLMGWGASTSSISLTYSNGYALGVFTANLLGAPGNSSQIFYSILDAATGAIVVPSTALVGLNSINVGARVVGCGTTAVLTYIDNSGNIALRTLDMTNPTGSWTGPTTIITAGQTGGRTALGVYELAPVVGDTNRFVVCYQTTPNASPPPNYASGPILTNTVGVEVYRINTLALVQSAYQDNIAHNVGTFGLRGQNGERFWVAYSIGVDNSTLSSVNAWALADGGAASSIATVSGAIAQSWGQTSIERVNATTALVGWTVGFKINVASTYFQHITSAAANTGPQRQTLGMVLGSHIQSVPNVGYFCVLQVPSVSFQGTSILCGLDFAGDTSTSGAWPARQVCALAPRLTRIFQGAGLVGNGQFSTLPRLTAAPAWPGGNVYIGLNYVRISAGTLNADSTELVLQPFDFASQLRQDAALLGDNLALSGGVPGPIDGQLLEEFGYAYYPEIDTTTITTSVTGGFLQTGPGAIYNYIVTYDWVNAAGQIDRSATSPAIVVDLTGLAAGNVGQASFALPNLGLSRRQRGVGAPTVYGPTVQINVWRTVAGSPGPYYRVTLTPFSNQLNGTSQTFTDNATSDTQLIAFQTLYTTGGFLDNFSPPSSRICIQHKQRWWLAGSDDPTVIWPSKVFLAGATPGFNEAQNFSATGAVRALASMDDKLIMFVQRNTGYGLEFITGDGPNDAGAQSDWTPPQPVPSDAGAIDQRSVASGPFGCVFRSPVGGPNGTGGIFLLTRDLQVQYISADVEDSLAANPIVTSAVVHPNAGRVYITCVPVEIGFTSGVRLVWDYLHGGTWSVDQIFDNDTSQASAGARHSWVALASVGGIPTPTVHWITAAGRVYRETNGIGANSYTDAGTWVPMTFQSPFYRPQLSGFVRFWSLQVQGDHLDDHDLSVTLTFDDAPSSFYSEAHTWTAPQIATFNRFPVEDMQMTVGNQKSKSMQITIADAAPTGATQVTGQGASLASITLELGIDQDKKYPNLPPAQRG